MSKYRDVFDARKLENEESEKEKFQKSRQMEIQKPETGNTENKLVNLGIKVEE